MGFAVKKQETIRQISRNNRSCQAMRHIRELQNNAIIAKLNSIHHPVPPTEHKNFGNWICTETFALQVCYVACIGSSLRML